MHISANKFIHNTHSIPFKQAMNHMQPLNQREGTISKEKVSESLERSYRMLTQGGFSESFAKTQGLNKVVKYVKEKYPNLTHFTNIPQDLLAQENDLIKTMQQSNHIPIGGNHVNDIITFLKEGVVYQRTPQVILPHLYKKSMLENKAYIKYITDDKAPYIKRSLSLIPLSKRENVIYSLNTSTLSDFFESNPTLKEKYINYIDSSTDWMLKKYLYPYCVDYAPTV